jgi:hypothetical protein
MGLTSLPLNPNISESPSEISVDRWDLVQEAIAERILGGFGNVERGVQVDELFNALRNAGIPEKRRACARIIRDLIPMNHTK